MPTYNGNQIFLTIDGTNVGAYFKEVTITDSVDEVDITAGSGQTYRERLTGLRDGSIDITLTYDDTALATYIQRLRPGVHAVEFGPEGNAAGKPRQVANYLFKEAPITISVEKAEVTIAVSGTLAGDPSVNMFTGATY